MSFFLRKIVFLNGLRLHDQDFFYKEGKLTVEIKLDDSDEIIEQTYFCGLLVRERVPPISDFILTRKQVVEMHLKLASESILEAGGGHQFLITHVPRPSLYYQKIQATCKKCGTVIYHHTKLETLEDQLIHVPVSTIMWSSSSWKKEEPISCKRATMIKALE